DFSFLRVLTTVQYAACAIASGALGASGMVSSRRESICYWTLLTMKATARCHWSITPRARTTAEGIASATPSLSLWESPTWRKEKPELLSACLRPLLQTNRQITGLTWMADRAKLEEVISIPRALIP
ncbi:MAG: hypothetical protein WCI05_13985, partial [Myxococcales bacterium]